MPLSVGRFRFVAIATAFQEGTATKLNRHRCSYLLPGVIYLRLRNSPPDVPSSNKQIWGLDLSDYHILRGEKVFDWQPNKTCNAAEASGQKLARTGEIYSIVEIRREESYACDAIAAKD